MVRRIPRQLAVGTVLLGLLILLALAAPYLAGDPNRLALDEVLQAPSARHWLGTDALGRDTAARVLHGGQVSLSVFRHLGAIHVRLQGYGHFF